MKRLMLVVPLSILLIFLLLFDAFKSFRDALIIISNIPFALIAASLRCCCRAFRCRSRRRSASSRCSGRRC